MNLGERVFPALSIAARLIVGAIFLIAGLDKVQAPGAFADAVRAFHILPPALVLPFALTVPWLELLVAAYLLSGFMTRVSAALAALLLISFVVAIARSLVTGDTAHACGCFGSGAAANPLLTWLEGGDTITWWDLIRDLILIALCAVLLVLGPGPLSEERALSGRRHVEEAA